jgi:5'-3' exonuclease, N-terminal resolvase-like domain
MKYLCFDISNMLYRSFYAKRDEADDTAADLAIHSALITLNKYVKQYKPDRVVMAFDKKSWRKEYTASDVCLSKKPYKGNRRKDMTPSQQIKYQQFLHHLDEFQLLIAQHTTIITLVQDRLEADDLIAGFCQIVGNSDNFITIISADSDLLQLVRYPNVQVISPATDKPQSLSDFDGDPLYYLFAKCLRGDPTDNVQSAYPRIRSTKIKEAYADPYVRTSIMKESWTNENKVQFKVEDLFAENQILIDLEKQPQDIRDLITNSIDEALMKERVFSLFHLLKFIGKHKLEKIKENIDQYIPMMSKR